jgi:hypothetical protein
VPRPSHKSLTMYYGLLFMQQALHTMSHPSAIIRHPLLKTLDPELRMDRP